MSCHGHGNVSVEDAGRVQSNDPALSEYKPTHDTKDIPAPQGAAWKEVIRHFTPSWFAVVMGTGVVAQLLNRLPYNSIWLYWLSVVVLALNTLFFLAALAISLIRYAVWPMTWKIMIRDPYHSLFLGAVPIGLATIVNMFVYVCVPAWGSWTAYLTWALWMADAVLALAVTFLLPYTIMTHEEQLPLSKINAAQLMPISTTVIAAASGSLVAGALPNPQQALATIVSSYIMLGIGLPMAFTLLVIYYQRLTLHKLPPREATVSVFLPLSPLGQGSFALMQLGSQALDVFPKTHTLHELAGPVLHIIGYFFSYIFWGFSLVWLAWAVATIAHQKRFPFNMGWWGFTFPLGVFASSTCLMGVNLPSAFFRILGTILSVSVVLLWMVVVAGTIRAMIKGDLLFTSCVRTLELNRGLSSPLRKFDHVI